MSNSQLIRGAFTALVTPFTHDASSLDVEAFENLVELQLKGGIQGLVPCGTTGESPTLTPQEAKDLIARTVRLAKGKAVVLAGTGSNDTHKTLVASQTALEAGADAVMLVMPYYNKPSQEGLYQHVVHVASQIGGAPVVLYNIPGRSVVDLSNDTLARILDKAPNVVAVKDATGNVTRCLQTVHRFGDRVSVMCGDDALTVPMMAAGAKGVISVTSNLYPRQVVDVCKAMADNKLEEARKIHMGLLPVHDVMFIEPNPAPAKAALAALGRLKLSLRLPLATPSEATQKTVVSALQAYDRGAL